MYLEQVAAAVEKNAPNNFNDTNNTTLVHGCLAGEEAAWAALFTRYGRLIYKIPLSFGFPLIEVEELFQEIALEIVARLVDLREPERLHPWIVTIARRVCIRRFRSASKYTTVDLQLLENEIERDVDSLEDLLIRLEEYNLLRKALAMLEPKCRILLTELFLKEQADPHADIAARLQMPLGSIGPTRTRCLDKLREQVEHLSQTNLTR